MPTRRRTAVAAAVALGLLAAGCGSPTAAPAASTAPAATPAFVATLQPALEARLAQLRTPGAIVFVDVPGHGSWLHTFGVGNLVAKTPVSADDHMRIASVTKTFTATVVLQLVDEGKVGLDKPVAEYLPGVVPNGANITVRQLLGMKSGLFNDTNDVGLNMTLDAQPERIWTNEELLKIAFSHPPNFPPGMGYEYANTNYLLAGMIAEKQGGAPLRDLMQKRIFDKLGMTHTSLPRRDDISVPEPHQRGYTYGTNIDLINAYVAALAGNKAAAQVNAAPDAVPTDATDWSLSYTYADGAAISTVADLRIWAKALGTGQLLSPATQRERTTFDPQGHYGLGMDITYGGLIGHNGAVPGFQTFVGWQPEKQATVVVLTNLLAAPNTYLGDSLTADELTKVIQKQLLPG